MKITNAWICRINNNFIEPLFGDIEIAGGKINNIFEKKFDAEKIFTDTSPDKNTLNAKGRVVTIPNINFHDHFYSRLAKGLQISGQTDNFHNILKNLWWKIDKLLTEEMIRASAQLGILDSIKNGVTYIFDHHSSQSKPEGSLNLIANVFNEIGIRGVLCFETTDRNGRQLAEAGLKENINFLKNKTGNDVKGLLGLHASFTVSNETLSAASEFVNQNNLGIHIHLCEDKVDREISKTKYNLLPVERLKQFKLINDKSILSHGIHLTKEDYAVIENSGAAIAFNPDSNMNNAVGLPDFKILPAAIPVLMGTDGMNSNPAKSLKQMFLLLRHSGKSFDSAFGQIQNIYFNQIKFVKKFFPDFPMMNVNDRADFIVWDYVPPTPFTKENFWGHFIYGVLESGVRDVIHNGNLLMSNFELKFNTDKQVSNIVKEGYGLYDKFTI